MEPLPAVALDVRLLDSTLCATIIVIGMVTLPCPNGTLIRQS
jgi:hypothetical protein